MRISVEKLNIGHSNMKEKINKVYSLLIPIMILGIYLDTRLFYFVLFSTLRILFSNRHTADFSF